MNINVDEYELIEAIKEYVEKRLDIKIQDSVNGHGCATILTPSAEGSEAKEQYVELGYDRISIAINTGEVEE